MENLMPILIMAGIILVALIVIGLIIARMYVKASSDMAFVRTGMGKKKVIKEGGAVVLPVLHQITWVKLSTLKLPVRRNEKDALITKDRMRVDVLVEFYMRVQPEADSIANAAQTLGDRTLDPEKLRELIEGKFVDALRAVAAQMQMRELHEQRADFVQKVQNNVLEDLKKNGLELETVSLTGFDQTSREHFNENNAFDAEGLTALTRIIEERRKERNEIERDNLVKIETKNLQAEQQTLKINKEKEYSRLEQEREIATRTAEENATKEKFNAEQNKIAQEARIESEKEVKKKTIETTKALEEQNIRKEQAIAEANIIKEKALQEANIEKEQAIESATIVKEQAVESATIEKQKAIKLAEQERDIEVANKSKETSLADQEANEARALAISAEEKVTTAREKEIANRAREITIIRAEEVAGSDAAKIKVLAQAEKEAAQDRAEAIKIEAKAKAEAIKIQADADERKYEVEAEGQEKLNEAENRLSKDIVDMRVKLQIIEHISAVIESSVKPLEKIEAFKVINVSGLTGSNGHSNGNGGSKMSAGGFSTQSLLDQLLGYRAQAPVVDQLLKEAGLGDNLPNVVKNVSNMMTSTKPKESPQVEEQVTEPVPEPAEQEFIEEVEAS